MNRKAISPVIAVVLLLMMTVAAAGAAFFWITTIQSRIQGQVGTQAASSAASSKQFKIVSAVCGNQANDILNITIQNVGELVIDRGFAAVTISDSNARTIETITGNLTANLESNGIATLNFTQTASLIENQTYGIKLTLPGGAEQTASCRAD